MKKFVYSFVALLAIMAFASCTKEASLPDTPPTKEENSNNGEGVFIPLELSFELYDFEKEEPGTKSAMAGAYAKEVPSNINYYLFRNGTLVKQQYISDITKFGVQLPDKTTSYNLYLLANVEQLTLPANTSESSIGSALSVVYSTQESFLQMCQSYGFPMAKKIEGFSATSSRAIMLERLVHILHVKMDISALAEEYFNEFKFTKLEVRNAAGNINPFAAASKASSILPKGDYAISPEDLAKVNSGEDVVLYVLENMRGNVFSTCSSWKERIPSNITPSSESEMATYIEFSARVKTATSEYDNVTFRTYLGTSVTNCNVQRNVVSTVTNSFLMDMISSEEWRVEPDEPDVKTLDLIPTNCYDFIVVENFPLTCQIDTEIPYDQLIINVGEAEKIPVRRTGAMVSPGENVSFNSTTGVLTISRTRNELTPHMFQQWDTEPLYSILPIRIRTADGLVDKTFEIKIQCSAFNVKWDVNKDYYQGQLHEGLLIVTPDSYCRRFMTSKNLSFDVQINYGSMGGTVVSQYSQVKGETEEIVYVYLPPQSSNNIVNGTGSYKNYLYAESMYGYSGDTGQHATWVCNSDEGPAVNVLAKILMDESRREYCYTYFHTNNHFYTYAQNHTLNIYAVVELLQNNSSLGVYYQGWNSNFVRDSGGTYNSLFNEGRNYNLMSNSLMPIIFSEEQLRSLTPQLDVPNGYEPYQKNGNKYHFETIPMTERFNPISGHTTETGPGVYVSYSYYDNGTQGSIDFSFVRYYSTYIHINYGKYKYNGWSNDLIRQTDTVRWE